VADENSSSRQRTKELGKRMRLFKAVIDGLLKEAALEVHEEKS
jgi:hypothetical protein